MTKQNKQQRVDPMIEQQVQALRMSDPDLQAEQTTTENFRQQTSTSPATNAANAKPKQCPFRFIPLKMGGNGGTHKPSTGSASLIHDEVPLDKLQDMTKRFYDKAFEDKTLDKFIHSHNDPHAERFAKWIHQKLSASTIWDDDRMTRDLTPKIVAGGRTAVVHDRSSAHVAAWYSAKRPASEVGRHFQLDECRVWMRLHFWAMRESGLLQYSPSFCDYYVRFIGHFVRVYEGTAPLFARESLRWSSDPGNIKTYMDNGREMKDVLGLSFEQALLQIPESEAADVDWPYIIEAGDAEEPQSW